MEIGTAIVVAAVWLNVSACALSPTINARGYVQAIVLAVIATAIGAW